MSQHAFGDLAPADIHRVTRGIYAAIDASFAEDRRRDRGRATMTSDEIRRRFKICEKWFRALRSEKQWTIARALDALKIALRKELDGETFVPDNRTLWLPQDGAR